jgi:hypothetical protein
VLAGLLLFAVTLLAYLHSPTQQIGDSRYSMLLSEHLLRHGNFDLREEFKLPLDPGI